MTDLPKKFNFGKDNGVVETPPQSPVEAQTPRKPRAMAFPSNAPVEPLPEAPERHHRTMSFPTVVAPPVVEHKPKILAPANSGEAHYARKERVRTITDILMDKAKAQSPDASGEIRGKIDTLLHHITTETMIQWGQLNLAPLQEASNIQAEIAHELQRINAVGVLTESKDAAMHGPKLIDRLTGKRPEQFEQRLSATKDALTTLMIRADNYRKSYAPEVTDLHLDGLALSVTLPEFSDPMLANIANSRVKTLLLAHQTGTMLLITLENTVNQCASLIGQIDSFLSVTMPNWKLAFQK